MPHSIRARPSQVRILDAKSPLLHLDKCITTIQEEEEEEEEKRRVSHVATQEKTIT